MTANSGSFAQLSWTGFMNNCHFHEKFVRQILENQKKFWRALHTII